MRTCLIVIMIELCGAGLLQAQTTDCTVSGFLFKADGSPALQAQVNLTTVVHSGSSFVLTPVVLTTDATGFASFTAPRLSTVWIAGTALGLTGPGDVAILIPDAAAATLDVLAQSAKPPVSGFNLTSGSNPTLALSLQDFGINLNASPTPPPTTVESFNGRTGAVALTSGDISTALNFTPVDPGTVVGAVNASSATIDDARLSAEVIRRSIANAFSAQQTFSGGLQVNGANAIQVSGGTQTMTATTNTDMMRFYRWMATPVPGWEVGSKINSQGAFYTNAWVVITGSGNLFAHPTTDPFMLGIWGDIDGPTMVVRPQGGSNAYLFSGLGSDGKYNFSIESNGGLKWGATTRAGMDTNLYRTGPGSLKTDGSLTIGNSLILAPRSVAGPPTLGTWSSGALIVDSVGVMYVCVTSGSPGSWQNLNGSAFPTNGSAQTLTFLKPDKTVPTTPITFQTNEAGSGNFYIGMGTAPNPFGTRRDQVLTWGYNQVADANDRVLKTEHALAYRMENYYTPNGTSSAAETHLQYISRAGVIKRLQAWFVDLNTDIIQTNITSDASSWTTSAGMNLLITPKLVRLLLGTSLFNDTNNLQFLRQKLNGTANDYGTLVYLNNFNQLQLGGSGTVGLQIDKGSVAPAITGKRFLCIDTKGVITSSVTPCSGT